MRENRTPGSVQGAPGNRCPYCDEVKKQMNDTGKVVPRAVYIGIATFAGLYIGFIVLGNLMGGEPLALMFWLQIVLLTFSGYVAGRIAKSKGWLNGLMVGMAAPIVLSVGVSLATMQLNMASQVFGALGVVWLVQSLLLCSLGGFVWDVQSKFRP